MRNIFRISLMILLTYSCGDKDFVQISGRIENSNDSIVSIWVEDSMYVFHLDQNDFFSGKINIKKSVYASFSPNSIDMYLSPGEDVEIYFDTQNISGSLYFRGNLGGINNYLKEQEMAVFFDKDNYALNEDMFVAKVRELIDEKIELLAAKNFDKNFTTLESARIRYSIGERIIVYPLYRMEIVHDYKPGKAFTDLMATFPINNDELFVTKDYRKFLLNYVYFQGGTNYNMDKNYSNGIADYILSHFQNSDIRNFLLSEVVYRYIWENNGLEGAEYLLWIFRTKCTDSKKIAYIEDVTEHWEKLLPGYLAPDFVLKDIDGNIVKLSDYKGTYLYISVWATWCIPCKSELPYIGLLEQEYAGKNVKFLTVCIDGDLANEQWKQILEYNTLKGIHTTVGDESHFNEDYMIISVPRFILIGPDKRIIKSNAPRPSGPIRSLLNEQEL